MANKNLFSSSLNRGVGECQSKQFQVIYLIPLIQSGKYQAQ